MLFQICYIDDTETGCIYEQSEHTICFSSLLAVGVGIALAIALNNIAIGISVGAIFVFGVLVLEQKKRDN